MKKIIFSILILFSIFFSANAYTESLSVTKLLKEQKDHIRWLKDRYGDLSRTDHPLVPNALEVFKRVFDAADKRSGRVPILYMIQEAGDPWVMSLEDGSVILTQKALEICYHDVNKAAGDARLAFVLGHEFAHLANDDFWKWTAFEALQRHGSQEKALEEIFKLIGSAEDVTDTRRAGEMRKEKEIHADALGLLYASMAGYDPKAVVDEKGKNFFQEWVNQITGQAAYHDENHPGPKHRAAFLLAYMETVKQNIDLFDFGVRLYQMRLYADALEFFKAVKKKFPCRELYNNIGLIHYQKAVNALAEYDLERAYEYRLSTVVDNETRVRNFRGRESSAEEFQREIRDAVNNFTIACNKDYSYIPARINLSSALIIKGDYHGAMKILKAVSGIKKSDPGILNNQAAAIYHIGIEMELDTSNKAVELLKKIIQNYPDYYYSFYNLGRILIKTGKKQEAENLWKEYLNREDKGIYAEIIRKSLNTENPGTNKNYLINFEIKPPVTLGDFRKKTEKQVADFAMYPVELENISGQYYVKNKIRVLVLEDVVKLVEYPLKQGPAVTGLRQKYGMPFWVSGMADGSQVQVYDNFAIDVSGGVVRKAAHF